jgi:hypothetical protein
MINPDLLIPRLRSKIRVTVTCWEWTGSLREGYGRVYLGRNRLGQAHRVVYEALVGPIPEGMDLDHLCRNPCCVNPAHLEPVTRRENLIRGDTHIARNVKKTHCPKGHPYSGDNLYIYQGKEFGRQCQICRREGALRSYYRKKQETK